MLRSRRPTGSWLCATTLTRAVRRHCPVGTKQLWLPVVACSLTELDGGFKG